MVVYEAPVARAIHSFLWPVQKVQHRPCAREFLLFHAKRDDNYPYYVSHCAKCVCARVQRDGAYFLWLHTESSTKHMRKHILINWVVLTWPWMRGGNSLMDAVPSNWIKSTIDFHLSCQTNTTVNTGRRSLPSKISLETPLGCLHPAELQCNY